jgi:hypothetical protein
MNLKHLVLAIGVALALLPANTAEAGLITYGSRSAFDAATGGLLPTETFEEGNVAPLGIVSCLGSFDASTSGDCFAPGDILPGLQLRNSPVVAPDGFALLGAGYADVSTTVLFVNDCWDVLRLDLSPGVNAIGFDLYSLFSESALDVAVYGSSGLLALYSVPTTNVGPGTFFGLRSTSDFITGMTISSPTIQAEGIDNVSFGSVPEPESLMLFGSAFLGLGIRRWRETRVARASAFARTWAG